MKNEYDANKGFTFAPSNKPTAKHPLGVPTTLLDRLKRIKLVSVFKWTLYLVIGVVLFNVMRGML